MKHSAQRGLTLIETAATLAILAIVATSAVSAFGDLRQRHQIRGVAAELASDLQFVRSEAVARNENVSISFSELPGGASCYVIHTGPKSACTCAASGAAQCTGSALPIKAVAAPAGGAVLLNADVASMLYHPVRGTVSSMASIDVHAAGSAGLRHVVSMLGRVRTCSPTGGLPGHKPC